jgi:hypothetical protein
MLTSPMSLVGTTLLATVLKYSAQFHSSFQQLLFFHDGQRKRRSNMANENVDRKCEARRPPEIRKHASKNDG